MLPFLSLICGTTCGTPPALTGHYHDCTDPEFKTSGSNHFILLACNETWTDILDAAEWTAKVAADDVELSVPGILTINAPEATPVPILGCGDEELFNITYLVDFETFYFDSALADWTYWKQRFQRHKLYRIMFVDCDGRFYLEDGFAVEAMGTPPATVSGETPGFKFDITVPPHIVEGEEGQAKWVTQFRIRTGKNLIGQALLPGVGAAIGVV